MGIDPDPGTPGRTPTSIFPMHAGPLLERRRGWVALTLVVALHAFLFAWWARQKAIAPASSARWSIPIRLTPRTVGLASQAQRPERSDTAASRTTKRLPVRRASSTTERLSTGQSPSGALSYPTISGSAVDPPIPAPAASQPAPLNLMLPKSYFSGRTPHNPALDDARSNSTAQSLGERMATTLGSDNRLVVEPLDGGRRRERRGADCIVVSPSRIGQIMPANDAAVRSPALVGACP